MSGPGTFLKNLTSALGVPPCEGCNKRAEAIDHIYRRFVDMIKPPSTIPLPTQQAIFYQFGGNIQTTKNGVAENRIIRISTFLVDPAGAVSPIKIGDDQAVILLGQGSPTDPNMKNVDPAIAARVAALNAALDKAVEAFIAD